MHKYEMYFYRLCISIFTTLSTAIRVSNMHTYLISCILLHIYVFDIRLLLTLYGNRRRVQATIATGNISSVYNKFIRIVSSYKNVWIASEITLVNSPFRAICKFIRGNLSIFLHSTVTLPLQLQIL